MPPALKRPLPPPTKRGKAKSNVKPRPGPPKPTAAPPSKGKKSKEKAAPMSFNMGAWDASAEGQKIMLYAPPGMGKSTLAMMAPNPVFIGLDDGARHLRHPKTGERPQVVMDETGKVLSTFSQVINVLSQYDKFDPYDTIVVDTGTRLEELACDTVMDTIKGPDGWVTQLEEYGWGKGYRHIFDTMMHPLGEFDELVRRGKNIIIICHQALENMDGGDYRRACPELQVRNNANVCNKWCGWCDHVFKIDHEGLSINSKKKKASAIGDGYAVFVHPEVGFMAKSRTLDIDTRVISFATPDDDSLWIELFGEDYDA